MVAYDRFDSTWGISLVLLADFAPAIVLGPILGAVVDRVSRRLCMVVSDVLRAVAFGGIAVVDSPEATVALALLAGIGTAVFKPAALASLPSLTPKEQAPLATSLYSVVSDAGYMVGPALAALLLVPLGASELLALNAATFAISAVVLSFVSFGAAVATPDDQGLGGRSLLEDAREGIRAAASMPAIRIVIGASAAAMFFGGVINVVELPFAKEAIGTSATGYSALVAVYGLGFVTGSLGGSRGGSAAQLKRRYLVGLALMGASGLLAGGFPVLAVCIPAFALAGFGNGQALVHERLILQSQVAERLQGRMFALTEALVAIGIGTAYISAGAIAEAISSRLAIILTGVGELSVALVAAFALRRMWTDRTPGSDVEGGDGSIGTTAEVIRDPAGRPATPAPIR